MKPEAPVAMVRCRVDRIHLNPSVRYVPESEFDAWRYEMEAKYRRVVTVDEISTWVPQSPQVLRNTTDPDTLHPVLKVRFEQRGPRGETIPVFRFLARDSPAEAAAARVAGLEVTPGYFLSSVPLSLYVVDAVDEETAAELDLMIDVA